MTDRYQCVLCGHVGRHRLRHLHAFNVRCWRGQREAEGVLKTLDALDRKVEAAGVTDADLTAMLEDEDD